MDIRKIKKLIELLEDCDVEELEIQEGDDSVRISRRREPAAGGHYISHYAAPAPQAAPAPAPAAEAAPAAESSAPAAPSGHAVKSPMVGTFYRAPSPTA
ncbi:MAG: acetyl-CoA carboxylase biotin carboxyl carrier protein, partial [Pseudomonadota bacterium]|nr:acetyl-CoA carboxylase biotin carboxyl carrier protein [Pseudomonadota bacterium]